MGGGSLSRRRPWAELKLCPYERGELGRKKRIKDWMKGLWEGKGVEQCGHA